MTEIIGAYGGYRTTLSFGFVCLIYHATEVFCSRNFSYKNDALGDPLLNEYHALALKLATKEEIETIKDYSFRVNEALKEFWLSCGVTLVDFKIEFGRLADGTIILADEISPDTCRLWDEATGERMDKDRFRLDLSRVVENYTNVLDRLKKVL